MANPREDALLNGRQAAESLGISVQAFRSWKVPVHSTRGRENLYSVRAILKVYVERREREWRVKYGAADDSRKQSENEARREQDDQRTRLLRAQADQVELKNEIQRQEVAPFAFITFVLGRTANEIAGILDGLPVELIRRLNLKPKDAEKIKSVTAAASDALTRIGSEDWLSDALNEFNADSD